MVDLVHHFQVGVRLEPVFVHEAAHGGAVAAIIILLQAESVIAGDFQEIDDEVANALVDLMPEIEVMRIERVVEIEHPGLNMIKAADRTLRRLLFVHRMFLCGRFGTRYCHKYQRRSVIQAESDNKSAHRST